MIATTTNKIPFSLVEKYASYNSDFVEFLAMEFGGDGKASCERLCFGRNRP
jgi:hypothetical protein